MLSISPDILKQFDTTLAKKAVPFALRADYRKWLRYYLDFRSKYPLPDSRSEQVRLFVAKLKEKNQTSKQQEQAAQALIVDPIVKTVDPLSLSCTCDLTYS